MLFRALIYNEILFYAIANYLHPEVRGYELVSACDAIRRPIRFKWVNDASGTGTIFMAGRGAQLTFCEWACSGCWLWFPLNIEEQYIQGDKEWHS